MLLLKFTLSAVTFLYDISIKSLAIVCRRKNFRNVDNRTSDFIVTIQVMGLINETFTHESKLHTTSNETIDGRRSCFNYDC